MEAKDTVMDELEMRIVLNKASQESPTIPLSYHTAIAETQAEITWDKAVREVVKWIEQQGYYSRLSPCECLTNNRDWQAKLKEWGVADA